jgi:RHS repeat-associated protein
MNLRGKPKTNPATSKNNTTMKLHTTIQTLAAVLTVALTHLAQARETGTAIPGVGVQPDTYFYTGKPYDADLGEYTFAYRSYNPEVNRWTTPDPSGFPDGANNRIYGATPTSALDPLGLVISKFATMGAEAFWGGYSTYKYGTMEADDVYQIAGPELDRLHQGPDTDWDNSCALRVDLALYDNGLRFNSQTPGVYPGSLDGNYGQHYIIAASGMRSYLNSTASGMFGTNRSDRTLGAGAQGIDQLQQDIEDLHQKTGRSIVAILAGGWHVGVLTSSDIGYTDVHYGDWSGTDSPKVWVLE